MIKIEHSVFALPFALAAAFMAARGLPEVSTFVLILLAVIFARSAAMAFNRYVDADIDAKNPRTQARSIPAGRLSKSYALAFTAVSAALFVGVTALLNWLTLMLAPVMLLILLGYSYTKRYTSYSHFVLGLALGCAPVGAWIAVRGRIELTPLLLAAAVTLWTAGFDIVYACQDIDFDRREKLFSLPARLGISQSLLLARALHIVVVLLLFFVGYLEQLTTPYWIGLCVVVLSLGYEHFLVKDGDLSKVTLAFFTMNGIVSLVFGVASIAAVFLRPV